jgi:hypothetical protein
MDGRRLQMDGRRFHSVRFQTGKSHNCDDTDGSFVATECHEVMPDVA